VGSSRTLVGWDSHARVRSTAYSTVRGDAADVAKRSAYREASLDVVLGAFARLRGIALLAGG
jgi:hypothetical protein